MNFILITVPTGMSMFQIKKLEDTAEKLRKIIDQTWNQLYEGSWIGKTNKDCFAYMLPTFKKSIIPKGKIFVVKDLIPTTQEPWCLIEWNNADVYIQFSNIDLFAQDSAAIHVQQNYEEKSKNKQYKKAHI